MKNNSVYFGILLFVLVCGFSNKAFLEEVQMNQDLENEIMVTIPGKSAFSVRTGGCIMEDADMHVTQYYLPQTQWSLNIYERISSSVQMLRYSIDRRPVAVITIQEQKITKYESTNPKDNVDLARFMNTHFPSLKLFLKACHTARFLPRSQKQLKQPVPRPKQKTF